MPTITQVSVYTPAATSVPVVGAADETGVSAVFTPQLGRNLYLTLSGTWAGTVKVTRATDGTTFNPLTQNGGEPYATFTANCDEVVALPTDGASTYRLDVTLTSGEVNYRLAQ